MTHRFTSLFFFLWLSTALSFTHTDTPEPDAGHIGIALARAKDSDFLTVEYVAANSPAAIAGIKKGDCVSAINGISTQGMSSLEARHSVEGDIGGMVKLTLRREGTADVQVSVVRRSLLDTYSEAAASGDPRAQFYLGHYYEHGPASVRDLAKAAEWYRKAADQNYASAQVNLAYMLARGAGIPKDLIAAAAWDLRAASQGGRQG